MAGTWIYSTPTEEIISIKCPSHAKSQLVIPESLQRGFRINTRITTITHPSIREIKVLQYYAPINNLSISTCVQKI